MNDELLPELKEELSVYGSNSDALLQRKLADARALLTRIYGRRFDVPKDAPYETRYVDFTPQHIEGRILWLPSEMCEIASITNGDGEVITADDYVTEPRLRSVSDGKSIAPASANWWPWYHITLKASSGKRWMRGDDVLESIAVEGHFAFSKTLPQVVRTAVVRLAAYMYWQKDTGLDIVNPKASKEGTMLMPKDLPDDVQAFMKGLRKVV